MTDSSLTSFQLFAALRGFRHFAVHAVSATSFELVWQSAPTAAVRLLVDVPSDALVRVRLLDAPRTEFEVRRASPHRLVREIAAVLQRELRGFETPKNPFAIDFTLLHEAIVALSSPLERALMAGALVHFLQPLVDADDLVCGDVARLIELHAVELQDAAIGRRVSLDSFEPLQ